MVVTPAVAGTVGGCTLTHIGLRQNPRNPAVFWLGGFTSFGSHVHEQPPCTWEPQKRFWAKGLKRRNTNEKSELPKSHQ